MVAVHGVSASLMPAPTVSADEMFSGRLVDDSPEHMHEVDQSPWSATVQAKGC
jgi:hypothetical protein